MQVGEGSLRVELGPKDLVHSYRQTFCSSGLSPYDPNLYVKSTSDYIIILVVYVDDIIITGSEVDAIKK